MSQLTLKQLKDLPLFECIEDKTLNLIKDSVIIKKLKKSQMLFAQRESINTIYIVLEGKEIGRAHV